MCKITVFKEVFDYYYDGDITKEQLADLLLMHYETKWGDGVDVNDIKDKDLKMIWKTLRHTVKKSVQNAKDYQDRQKAKKTIKDVKPEEFELPNCQISNITDLNPSNSEEMEQPQSIVDDATEAIKTIEETIPNEFMDGLKQEETFMTDEEKYGIDVMDLIDENPEIINALKTVVEYRCGDDSKLMEAQGANSKIERIVKSKSLDVNFNSRVERFCADYIKEYTEYVLNNIKVKQIA